MNASGKPILIIGGGIAGVTAALEAAEVGCHVILVEKEACLGGRVMRMHRYFPKMCPPTCGFEINVRRIKQNPRITVFTLANVAEVTGKAGHFRARITIAPRYVTGTQPIDDAVVGKLTGEREDEFNYGMSTTKALFTPHDMAYPSLPLIDRAALSDGDIEVLADACGSGAIDLEMTAREVEFDVGAVIMATGWEPYDANRLDNLGYGQCPNVITNVMMERLAAKRGPTGGQIVRPSDGKPVENVAFVQCAGSRDDKHLSYCSAVCCTASLKQARYLREQNENARVTIYYIDVRTIGRLENFYYEMLDDENYLFIKGKVGKITEEPGNQDLILDVEDTLAQEKLHPQHDLVVLATGMVPKTADTKFPFELKYDEYGFFDGSTSVEGVYAAGCAKHPCDVSRTTRDATGAALKAMQVAGPEREG